MRHRAACLYVSARRRAMRGDVMTASGDGQTAGARIVGRAGQAARRGMRLTEVMRAGAVLIAVTGVARGLGLSEVG